MDSLWIFFFFFCDNLVVMSRTMLSWSVFSFILEAELSGSLASRPLKWRRTQAPCLLTLTQMIVRLRKIILERFPPSMLIRLPIFLAASWTSCDWHMRRVTETMLHSTCCRRKLVPTWKHTSNNFCWDYYLNRALSAVRWLVMLYEISS